jgi:hypothetical protein
MTSDVWTSAKWLSLCKISTEIIRVKTSVYINSMLYILVPKTGEKNRSDKERGKANKKEANLILGIFTG